MTVQNTVHKIKDHKNRLIYHKLSKGWTGNVFTKNGIVDVHSWTTKYDTGTSLVICHDCRVYWRRYDKNYSQEYIVTLCKRFAKEITGSVEL